MPDGADREAPTVRIVGSIAEIAANDWDALANPEGAPENPFVGHAFLKALEASHSVSQEGGWTPFHLVTEAGGRPVAAAPTYIKAHSFGEYIFDHNWAQAYERAGGQYYPKLLCASPFTPVPGPRLLAKADDHKRALAAALVDLSSKTGASSVHVNFLSEADMAVLAPYGFMHRTGVQYHWFNRGYDSYDDFLAALSSRKRKALRRERKEAASGLKISRLTGAELEDRHWRAFWKFYQDTGDRKWGRLYLTEAFFDEIAETMADKILMVIAESGGEPIAGALNFIGGDAIYGRYWGQIEDRPFLHFEICYHQAIEFAIERRLARVEAGAQGEHKIARGYEPVLTHSAHWIANPGLREAIRRFLTAETQHVAAEVEALRLQTPFRRNSASEDR